MIYFIYLAMFSFYFIFFLSSSTFHPFMYLENKNYHVLHITSCFFRMSMKNLQFQSLFTCLTYNPFMYLENIYYYVLHITSHFFIFFLPTFTYNAFSHLQCFPTYTLYIYLCLILFKCNHFYAFKFTFGSHLYTIPNTHIYYRHII